MGRRPWGWGGSDGRRSELSLLRSIGRPRPCGLSGPASQKTTAAAAAPPPALAPLARRTSHAALVPSRAGHTCPLLGRSAWGAVLPGAGASRGHLRRPRPVPLHSTSAPLWPVGIYLVSGIRHCAAWVSWEENVTSTVYRSWLRVWVSSKPSLLPNPKGFLGTVETPRRGSPDARGPPELTVPPPLPPAAPTPAPSSSGIAESEPALPPQLRS